MVMISTPKKSVLLLHNNLTRKLMTQTWQVKILQTTAKPHYIEPQGTGINGSIYPRLFEISHIHLFALIVAGQFTVVR